MILSILLAACHHAPPETAAPVAGAPYRWIDVDPGKPLCLSTVPDAGPLQGENLAAFDDAVAALQAGDLPAGLARLVGIEGQPAIDALRAVIELFAGQLDAPMKLVGLAEAHPNDPCLVATTGLAVAATGRMSVTVSMVTDARRMAPDDADLALLSWWLDIEPIEQVRPVLEAGLAAHPDHPGLSLAIGVERLLDGQGDAATPLEVAYAGGVAEAADPLLRVYWKDHRRADYLRMASRLELPLGDGGAIGAAEDPEAALAELLGLAAGGTLFADLQTTEGTMRCALWPDRAPVSVANFVGLAKGTQPWYTPDGAEHRTAFYDGSTFHRVIPEFMIQGGDPLATGQGDPGYRFLDEIVEESKFDRPGVLAMANAGPDTNGSQFFVTEAPVAYLDGRHTILGTCDDASVEVVKRIARVERDERDRPVEPVVLEHVTIRVEPPAP